MPKGEGFWNPYRMIPIRENIERSAPVTDEKFSSLSGLIHCTLENITPLFISKGTAAVPKPFLTRKIKVKGNKEERWEDQPVIPGSSLKGMLRSLAETIGGGCSITNGEGVQQNPASTPCSRVDSLCIACQMFGMMERGKDARVHKGNVSISDGVLQESDFKFDHHEILMGTPATRHRSFYKTPETEKFDGKSRKMYFHQPKVNEGSFKVLDNLKARAWTVRALSPGYHFDFQVSFSNLRREELNLLIYTLVLESDVAVSIGDNGTTRLRGPMRHKLGNAKPLGMGSCHISMVSLEFFGNPVERFNSLKNDASEIIKGDPLKKELQTVVQPFLRDNCPTMEQLRKMMVWDPNDDRTFHYPDFYWFKAPGNSALELKNI